MRCDQSPSASRRASSASALSPQASAQRLSPVQSCIARAARSVPGDAPHEVLPLVVRVLAHARVELVREPASGACRHATSRIPVSPANRPARAGSGGGYPATWSGPRRRSSSARQGDRPEVEPRLGRRRAGAARRARARRPRRRRRGSSAAAASRHPSHSSAGQSSSGSQAASVSATISRIRSSTRPSSQGSSVSGSNASGRNSTARRYRRHSGASPRRAGARPRDVSYADSTRSSCASSTSTRRGFEPS